MSESVDKIVDARIISLFAILATSEIDKEELLTIFGTFGTLLASKSALRLELSTIFNVTAVVLFYSSPLLLLLQDLVRIIGDLNVNADSESNLGDVEESNDTEEFANWLQSKLISSGVDESLIPLEDSVLPIAKDFVHDFESKALGIGFSLIPADHKQQIFLVLKCKLIIDSVYIEDIELPQDVIAFAAGNEPFDLWFKGFYLPYKYYWDNYGKLALSDEPVIKFHEFCQLDSAEGMLESLIFPIKVSQTSEKTESENWLSRVVHPVLCWKGNDFTPLLNWIMDDHKINTWSSSRKQRLWKSVFSSLVQAEVAFEHYEFIIEAFLKLCYYDAMKEKTSEKNSSLEMLQTFDLIKESTSVLIPVVPKASSNILEGDINYNPEELFNSYSDFAHSTPLQPLLKANKDCLILLSEMIETCSTLYPINKTTVSKYLQLKYSKASNIDDLKKESSKILVGLRTTNAPQLLKCLDLFKRTFIRCDSELEFIDNLMVDRLLFHNLFDLVVELYENGKLGISDEALLQLLLKKFWESVNNSDNFDDRLGYLSEATSCILILDKISFAGDKISSESKSSITKLKHLLKVFSNIKHFKITLGRNVASTPKEIIRRFGSLPSNEELRTEMESVSPMGLISVILTDNPKSYVAFEKLFKVLNDFLIFLDDTNSDSSYYFQRLMAACIESALLDNNFVYAHRKAVELLNQYSLHSDHNLNNLWMTFYQVGNYHSPEWYTSEDNYENELGSNRIDVLQKQSEILSKYLLIINRTDITIDNSRIIVDKWVQINNSIEEWYHKIEHLQHERSDKTSARDLQENITATANEILNDAANTTNQASEKLSNLFVSGLGWAIGANMSHS